MGRKGNRNFKRCQLKVIKLVNYFRAYDAVDNTYQSKKPESGPYTMRQVAFLRCPKTREGDLDVSSNASADQLAATAELQMIAAVTTCQTCTLSRLDPVQYEDHQAEVLRARAERQEAQNKLDLAEKQAEYIQKLGEEELAKITGKYMLDTAT